MKKISSLLIIILLCFCLVSYSYGSEYVWSSNVESDSEEVSVLPTSENSNFLNLSSSAAILIDVNNGNVLYEHNSNEQLRPASVTKVTNT